MDARPEPATTTARKRKRKDDAVAKIALPVKKRAPRHVDAPGFGEVINIGILSDDGAMHSKIDFIVVKRAKHYELYQIIDYLQKQWLQLYTDNNNTSPTGSFWYAMHVIQENHWKFGLFVAILVRDHTKDTVNSTVIGYAATDTTFTNINCEDEKEIFNINILEIFDQYRNKGIGAELVRRVEIILMKEHSDGACGNDEFKMRVSPLESAIKFWEKLGYKREDSRYSEDNKYTKVISKEAFGEMIALAEKDLYVI